MLYLYLSRAIFLSTLVYISWSGADDLCETKICNSQGCKETASRLKKDMDLDISPCDDLYQHACGGFIRNNKLLDSQIYVSQFTLMENLNERKLISVMNESAHASDSLPTRLIKLLFSSCMDQVRIDKLGTQNFMEAINAVGGWPVISKDSDVIKFNWLDTTVKCKDKGLATDGLLTFHIMNDARNTSVNVIHIEPLGLWTKRADILKGIKETSNDAHLQFMINVAVAMGAERKNAVKDMTDAYNLLINLANNTMTDQDYNDGNLTYNKFKIKELQRKFSNIQWLQLANKMLSPVTKVTMEEAVIVTDVKYIEYLNSNIKKMPKRVLANHMIWRAIQSFMLYMNQPILDIRLKYFNILYGQKDHIPRQKLCTMIITRDDVLQLAAGALYARKFYLKGTTEVVENIINETKAEFQKSLETISWMDAKTRTTALKKLKKMTSIVGYPKELLEDKVVNEYFKGLEFKSEFFMENMLKLGAFKFSKEVKRLRVVTETAIWEEIGDAATVNAFYGAHKNTIYFPAGFLQGVNFGIDYPGYLNFGSTGYTCGHEITHGFDTQGSQFDADGNMINWWEADTAQSFKQKSQCFVNQYGIRDPETNITVDGKNALDENIADNGGIKEAYFAYQSWAKRNKDLKLPGFTNYTSNQMFWLAFANSFCETMTSQYLSSLLMYGSHTVSKYRVNFMAKNMQQFADDWHCPNQSPMVTEKRCQVW